MICMLYCYICCILCFLLFCQRPPSELVWTRCVLFRVYVCSFALLHLWFLNNWMMTLTYFSLNGCYRPNRYDHAVFFTVLTEMQWNKTVVFKICAILLDISMYLESQLGTKIKKNTSREIFPVKTANVRRTVSDLIDFLQRLQDLLHANLIVLNLIITTLQTCINVNIIILVSLIWDLKIT